MSCGAEIEANSLHTELTKNEAFVIPAFDLSSPEFNLPPPGAMADPVRRLTNEDLTTGTVNGTGTFDVLMRAMNSHLTAEFQKNRLVGAEYSRAYVSLTEAAMDKSIQFLLGQDQSYWGAVAAQQQALLTQMQVVTARVQMQIAKVQLASLQMEASLNRANFALAKMKLSTESAQYCSAKYTLENLLPLQRSLLVEQVATQRAQTSNLREDGAAIEGTLGAQRRLYEQQITSYQRDAEMKATKVFTDAWITQKTLDEDLPPPLQFTNASLEELLINLKVKSGIGTATPAPVGP